MQLFIFGEAAVASLTKNWNGFDSTHDHLLSLISALSESTSCIMYMFVIRVRHYDSFDDAVDPKI